MTSRLSGSSVLKSTQIGQLVQYLLVAFYYLVLGRFSIDLFGTKTRDKSKDWQIYLSLFIAFVVLYTVMANWHNIFSLFSSKNRQKMTGVHNQLEQ
jgi:hypothetical protein